MSWIRSAIFYAVLILGLSAFTVWWVGYSMDMMQPNELGRAK